MKTKKLVVSNFVAVLGGVVLAGIIGTSLGEQFGYHSLALYLYGLFGHKKVAKLLESRIK